MIDQAAAVPFRTTETGYEILLITTRKGKWSLPKGIIDPGETPQETAAKETFEEAGVEGDVVSHALDTFTYRKWGDILCAEVYLLAVHTVHETYQESSFRQREWFPPDRALSIIRKRMRKPLASAIALLNQRYPG